MDSGITAAGKERILEQAQWLFSQHGYHGVSIRDIAQACQLSNAALYYHFGSKQNLYLEVLKAHVAAVARCLQEAGAGPGTVRERLNRAALAYAWLLLENKGAILIHLRDLAQFDLDDIQQLLPSLGQQAPDVIAGILDDGIAQGEIGSIDAQRVGVLFLGMVNTLAVRRLQGLGTQHTLQEDVDLAVSVLLDGIQAGAS